MTISTAVNCAIWKCNNCHHLDLAVEKPERCPVCGVEADKPVPHEVLQISGTKTLKNLRMGFIAESQAHQRNQAFALKAEQEGYRQVAKLLRAIAEAEAIHAFNLLRLLGGVSGTQENLESASERENLATNTYPQFIKEANEEDNTNVARIFSYSRNVERRHAKLYEKALEHMLDDVDTEYYVCSVCGYVSDGEPPDECPICGAPKEMFKKVVWPSVWRLATLGVDCLQRLYVSRLPLTCTRCQRL